jgi:hypothetical protein
MFNTNLGPVDCTIRLVFGVALLALVWIGTDTPWGYLGQTLWGYLGVIPLATGAFGWSPLYALFRVSSIGSFHRTLKHA